MRAALVLIQTPFTDDVSGMHDINNSLLINALIAKSPVKTLNKSVLCRLIGLMKPQIYVMLKGPLVKGSKSKLLPLVSSYPRRIAAKQCIAVQNTRDLHP